VTQSQEKSGYIKLEDPAPFEGSCPWFLGQERKENSKEEIFAGFLRKEEEGIFAFRLVIF
jgi:hypothetical protein